MTIKFQKALMGSVAAAAMLAVSSSAFAGGIAVREQSAQFQGSSFAGSGAGGGLSSSFWNSAAFGEAGHGMSTESDASLIRGKSDFDRLPGSSPFLLGRDGSETSDRPAIITSSYSAYRLNEKMVLGLAINAPFGLSTELDNRASAFAFHHRSAALLTLNANPVVSYEILPGLHIAGGAQIEYAKLRFKTGTNPAAANGGQSAVLNGDDIGVGFTAGLLWKPNEGTSIGLGYRSSVAHSLEGDQFVVATTAKRKFSLDLDTPETVNLSIRQAIGDRARILGTVEWTHWDRLDIHPVIVNGGAIANFDFQWHDGWFFALGGEYDFSDKLTVRSGVAYEISPIQNPSERLVQTPDSDRIWLSLGATYKVSDKMALDFGYSHVFFDDSTLNRLPANGANLPLVASVQSSADIFSVAVKMKFGGEDHHEESHK